ncbi:MAG: TIGR00153 family protein [Verrucomicrobia bacterium]|nr:TIGR00153 family protein [Verrucomicrobiota bacterium]
MLTIARLFGKSPFAPLQTHMSRVSLCLEKLAEIISHLPPTDKIVEDLCKLEHEADLTKNDIRNHLPKNIFLPMERGHFLDILSIQDSLADQAEEIGLSLKLRPLNATESLRSDLQTLFKKSYDTFLSARQIIGEIDELLEASFGGIEAEKVKSMVEQTAHKEYEAKKFQRLLNTKLFAEGGSFSAPDFYLWTKLIEDIGNISVISERLANRIRMVLELK